MEVTEIDEGEKLVAGFMSSGLRHSIIDHIPGRIRRARTWKKLVGPEGQEQ